MAKKNTDCICISKEEYEELLECRTYINLLHRAITCEHENHIRKTGTKAFTMSTSFVEMLSGYIENENYFKKLMNERKKQYENDIKKVKFEEFQGD